MSSRPLERRAAADQRPPLDLRAGLAIASALSLLLAGLMLSVPELQTVAHRLVHARWGWVAVACALEIASCVGYVLAFQGIFRRLPSRFAALVAVSELAFGAVVPLGGAGGIAAGGWLLARSGMPVRRIAERSAVLFLLTSATNVAALLLAAGGLMLGIFDGPHDLLRAALPAAVALIVLVSCLLLARQATGKCSQRFAPARARAVRALATTLAQTLQRETGRAPHPDARPGRPEARGPAPHRRAAAGHDDTRVPALGLGTRSST